MIRLILITLCFSACLSLNAQTCCEDAAQPCTPECDGDWDWEQHTRSLNLPQPEFDECDISVTYCRRQCISQDSDVSHKTQWTICEWAIFPGPGGCQDCDNLTAWLFNGQNYVDNDRLKAFKLDIIRVLTYELFEEHLQLLMDNDDEELVNCNDGVHAKYAFTESSCAQTCYVSINGDDYIHQLACTEYYCCGIKIEYCYNPVTEEIETTEEQYGNEGPCYATPHPKYLYTEEDCPDGDDVSITPNCEDQCNYILNE